MNNFWCRLTRGARVAGCRWLAGATLLVCGWAYGGEAISAGWVAEVLFVSGECSWSAPGAAAQALTKGQRLPVGARITTGADGRAYVATADQGFWVLRPETTLRVDRYAGVDGQPVDIRLVLEQGVARVVSGKAAARSPSGFRMETPVAAIGVRGTDFSVRTEADLTQVVVRSGGVVVSPLSETCRAGAAGACSDAGAMDLFAREAGKMLEVRRDSALPLKLPIPAGNGPDGRAPPAADENLQIDRQQGGQGARAPLPTSSLEVRIESAVAGTVNAPQPPVQPTIYWGRWAGSGSAAEDNARFRELTAGRERVAMNSWFVLARDPGKVVLPRDGRVSLGLTGADALIVSQAGQVLASARVDNARLLLDFGAQRFETSFTTEGGGYTAHFRGAGNINANGTFGSSWQQGTTGTLSGAVEATGRGAAFLFSQPITGTNAVATGVTHWAR